MRCVIIGNGIAGITAAEEIRKGDPSSEIVVITKEPYHFYSRIMLINFLAGEINEDALYLKPEKWYEENSIRVLLGKRVDSLDLEEKGVTLADGRRVGFDRLLIATGGRSFVPPIKGVEKEGVFTLRSLDDAKAIIKYVDQGNINLILIGGGVLGLEAGNALRKRGCNVTVVEFFPRLLPRQMDPEGAELLKNQMEGMGFRFFLGVRSKEVIGRKAVEGLLLEDGRKVVGDIVIVSAGIRPDLELAKGAGLQTDKGIVVNDKMETSHKDVYAAGDVAEFNGRIYGIWPAAEEQGSVAGINMAGGDAVYTGTIPSNVLKVAGIDLMAIGEIDPEDRYDVVRIEDRESFLYKKLVFHEDRLIGAILYGDLKERNTLLKAMMEGWSKGRISSELKWIK